MQMIRLNTPVHNNSRTLHKLNRKPNYSCTNKIAYHFYIIYLSEKKYRSSTSLMSMLVLWVRLGLTEPTGSSNGKMKVYHLLNNIIV